jgi:hypothetical protein
MSQRTWEMIDDRLHQITREAAKIGNPSIYSDADNCIALIRNLAGEIRMEDWSAEQERTA